MGFVKEYYLVSLIDLHCPNYRMVHLRLVTSCKEWSRVLDNSESQFDTNLKYDWNVEYKYRKIPNISPGLIEVRKHFLGGSYLGGGYIWGGCLY